MIYATYNTHSQSKDRFHTVNSQSQNTFHTVNSQSQDRFHTNNSQSQNVHTLNSQSQKNTFHTINSQSEDRFHTLSSQHQHKSNVKLLLYRIDNVWWIRSLWQVLKQLLHNWNTPTDTKYYSMQTPATAIYCKITFRAAIEEGCQPRELHCWRKILKKSPKILKAIFWKSVLKFFCLLTRESCVTSFMRISEKL